MKFIIDRFEGDFAVLETADLSTVNIPKMLLPIEAAEGDIVSIIIEKGETQDRAKQMETKMQNLFKRSANK